MFYLIDTLWNDRPPAKTRSAGRAWEYIQAGYSRTGRRAYGRAVNKWNKAIRRARVVCVGYDGERFVALPHSQRILNLIQGQTILDTGEYIPKSRAIPARELRKLWELEWPE